MRQRLCAKSAVAMTGVLLALAVYACTPAFAGEHVDGYRGATWGMSAGEVRGTIKELGLKYVDYEKIVVRDRMFGTDAEIKYLAGEGMPLITVRVTVKKPAGGKVPYDRIKSALTEKYGTPLKKRVGHEDDRLEMWLIGQTSIWLMVDDAENFAVIVYTDVEAEKRYY